MNSRTYESLKPTTVEELNDICMSLKSGKAPGYDDTSMHVIKNTFEIVSEPLKNIINLSFSKGIFPDKLNVAKVIPGFKADEPDLFTNYRPISLLPNFSTFFEKVMHNRLVEFANSQDILYQLQFGFRKNHSTALSLTYLVKDGAYYCYCAYVLRISRYSEILSVVLTNAGIFLRGLNL